MKKTVFTLLSILALASLQLSAANQSGFGLKVGVVSASMSESIFLKSQESRRIGFTVGAFYNLSLGSGFSIQPEVLFTQKGIKGEGLNVDQHAALTYTLNYLEIPVLARLTLSDGDVSPYICAGPYAGFKLSVNERVEYSNGDVTEITEDPYMKKTDFGLMAGAGVQWRLGSGAMQFEACYTHGLADVFEVYGESGVKNNTLSVRLGYRF